MPWTSDLMFIIVSPLFTSFRVMMSLLISEFLRTRKSRCSLVRCSQHAVVLHQYHSQCRHESSANSYQDVAILRRPKTLLKVFIIRSHVHRSNVNRANINSQTFQRIHPLRPFPSPKHSTASQNRLTSRNGPHHSRACISTQS